MDDFGKKTVVAAIAIVCLTIAIITSFSVGNIVYPIKSIIKTLKTIILTRKIRLKSYKMTSFAFTK